MVRLALLQLQLQNTEAKAVEHVVRLLKNAAAAESNIVCLPEQWYPKHVVNLERGLKQVIEIAKEHSMTIIAGGLLEEIKGNLHISCPVIANDGSIRGRQFKIHPYGDEKKAIKAGIKAEIFDSGSFKFGIAICHDVVFPEVSRALTFKGADIIFYPSRITEDGIKPWQMYVQVRALENRVPTAAPNACGKGYGGKSIAADLEYDKKSNIAVPKAILASVNEQLLVVDMDLDYARKIRKIRFEDVKRDVYESL
ncbi:MAG: carbon-nitrogen hydrolase family protein [Nitrososphaerales archaeon]